MNLREQATRIAQAAVRAADPYQAVRAGLRQSFAALERAERIFVVGAGKAASRMARAVEDVLGDRIHAGWINTKYGHCQPEPSRIHCHECGHPVPDDAGVEGARRIAEIAQSAGERDHVICLISGGASALMPFPSQGIALSEKQEVTRLLLACGATIHEINTVRKHLSAIKGGRLARLAAPAAVTTFIVSDVVADDLDVIGSGPTVPDRSTFADARQVLERRNIWSQAPAAVRRHIEAAIDETPKPGDAVFEQVRNVLVATNRQALDAARSEAERLGFGVLLLASTIEGETRDIAGMHAAILREACESGNPVGRPACILSGGETTVTIRGDGKGGRNQEFALAAAIRAAGLQRVLMLSFGTDGTDGPTDAAGAFADGSTVERARVVGLDAEAALAANDSYPLFRALGDLYITGPTNTNVMDLHILLVG